MITTVLLDLDDTIFDHKYGRLCALSMLQNSNSAISKISLDDLETEHEKLLQGNYTKVLDRTLTVKDSMIERTYFLFKKYGINLSFNEAKKITDNYNQTYEANRRAIPGIKELMKDLKKNLKVGIVSNGIYEIQIEKVRLCEIEELIDFIILSEEVKSRKPEKAIFEAAIERAGSIPEEVIYIGDSWTSDILGATECGMKTIWLNRYGQDCPDPKLTYEIQSYDDINNICDYILRQKGVSSLRHSEKRDMVQQRNTKISRTVV